MENPHLADSSGGTGYRKRGRCPMVVRLRSGSPGMSEDSHRFHVADHGYVEIGVRDLECVCRTPSRLFSLSSLNHPLPRISN